MKWNIFKNQKVLLSASKLIKIIKDEINAILINSDDTFIVKTHLNAFNCLKESGYIIENKYLVLDNCHHTIINEGVYKDNLYHPLTIRIIRTYINKEV